MILDARLDNVSLNWTARVAIVGAGPAGMALARELGGIAEVLVIEGGGLESDPSQQALFTGECVGLNYPLTETRARQFGGSSALWAGYCAVFDSHDFSSRHWVPGSGWPFGIEEILPFYDKAAEMLNLGDPAFDACEIARRARVDLPFDRASIVTTAWRFGSPTVRFGESLRQEFETSRTITTLLHANVVDIHLDAGHGAVKELVIRTLDGGEGRISADIYILACGGIETPRLLLNSDSQVPRGLANAHGLVGRYFMEHPHRTITPLELQDLDSFERWTRREAYGTDKEFILCLGLPATLQEEAKILNARAHIYRTPQMEPNETPKVGLFLEQAPNPNSRVRLSDSRDPLGMRRTCLDWQLTDLDWKTFVKTAAAVARGFESIGAARMHAPIDAAPRECEPVLHSNHHLGTTRMSVHREEGVVDPDCRVHDLSNLYIIGGSIYPTVSWANPTFTLMALTFRLAAHLRTRLESTSDIETSCAFRPV